MRTRIIATLALVIALVPATAIAQAPEMSGVPEPEAGTAYFEDGTCVEADGTAGLVGGDGQCITPADYDILFGYDNLAATRLQTDESQSVAEAYNITPDGPSASERLLGEGLVEVPFTFVDAVGVKTPGTYLTIDGQVFVVTETGNILF